MKQIEYIPINKLIPHPDNPRKELGDLTELAASIKEAGIYQNLTVVPALGDTYKIIIGHRRHAAAKLAGLASLPCIVTDMDEETQLATMLLENMQRSDLTIVEQAHGMQLMLDIGYTADEISQKTGFSRSTVDKRLKVAQLPHSEAKAAEERGGTLEDFVKLEKIENTEERENLLQYVGTSDYQWKLNYAIKKQTINKNRPVVEEYCSTLGLKECGGTEYYSCDYKKVYQTEIDKEEFNVDDYFNKIKLEKGKKYFYCFMYEHQFNILEKAKKEKDKKAIQISEKQKKADKLREQLKEKNIQMAQARTAFYHSFTAFKKYREVILNALIYFTLRRATDREYYYDEKYVKERAITTKSSIIPDMLKDIKEFADKPEAAFTALVASFYDCEDRSSPLSCTNYYWSDMMPQYQREQKLIDIYDVLCELGYQLSTEEEQLLDGTHHLYFGITNEEAEQ